MAEARYAILLDGLELQMGLGIHAEELAGPQRVTVSVRLDVVLPAAPARDAIDEVLDYDFVRTGIRELAATHIHLQETLCERIAALCLSDPRVERVTVRSAKLDIYPDAAIGCEVVRGRL